MIKRILNYFYNDFLQLPKIIILIILDFYIIIRKGKFMDDYWIPGQRMMGDIKFLDSLRAFDKDNVPQHIMEKIRIKYINMELFDPNNVKKVYTYDIVILFLCVKT